MPLTTAHRAPRGPIDDHLSFEPTLPGRAGSLGDAMTVPKRCRHNEDDLFPAFRGSEELERRV